MGRNGTRSRTTRSRAIRQGLAAVLAIAIAWGAIAAPAAASALSDRALAFPQWISKPPTRRAVGDLTYPDWMGGTWRVTSTLVEMAAPLAPKVMSPGYDGNKQYLDRPITFDVRFVPQAIAPAAGPIPVRTRQVEPPIVADRAFNGESIARTYLGDGARARVRLERGNPNRQITSLTGDRELISDVIERASDTPDPQGFIATELVRQTFRSRDRLGNRAIAHLNEVETTTVYRHRPSAPPGEPSILGDQMTAIFLDRRDNNYPRVRDRPVALYRYRLEFQPASPNRIRPEAPTEAR